MTGSDTGERIDVGTGPGIDLDLEIPAGAMIDITFDDQRSSTDPNQEPTLQGVTVLPVPPHTVVGIPGDPDAVIVPYRANNLLIENLDLIDFIYYMVNEGLIAQLDAEDVISWDKRQVYRVVIQGVPGDRVYISAW